MRENCPPDSLYVLVDGSGAILTGVDAVLALALEAAGARVMGPVKQRVDSGTRSRGSGVVH